MSLSTAFAMLQILALSHGATPLDSNHHSKFTLEVRLNYHKWIDIAGCKNLEQCNEIGQKLIHKDVQDHMAQFSPYVKHRWFEDCSGKKWSGWVVCYNVKSRLR